MIKRRTFIMGLGALTSAPVVMPAGRFLVVSPGRAASAVRGPSPPTYPSGSSADGFNNAPTGTMPYPALLNAYAFRPPWRVAGVEYPVGIDRKLYPTDSTLKDPREQENLPPGATIGGNRVTISQNDVTLDGFDFSLGGSGNVISINNGVNNTTVTNCKFASRTNSNLTQIMIWMAADANILTVRYCSFDGGGSLGYGSQDTSAPISIRGGRSITIEYCRFHDFAHHAIDMYSRNQADLTCVFRYNVFDLFGANGGHPNPWYMGESVGPITFRNGHFDFNLIYEPASPVSAGADTALAIFNSESKQCYLYDNTANYNTIVSHSKPTSGIGAIFSAGGYGERSDGNSISYNYYDPRHTNADKNSTGVWGVWSSGTGPGTRFINVGNIDMTTGKPGPKHPAKRRN